MGHRIHHYLDRRTSVFGIRGRYIHAVLTGAGLSAVTGIAVGQATEFLLGLAATLGGCVLSYLGVMWLQAGLDERDLGKMLGYRRMPMCWSSSPSALRNIWKGIG